MIRMHFYFLSSRSIAAWLLLCALSCSTLNYHMDGKRKIKPEGCASSSHSTTPNHNLVACVACKNHVDKDYCVWSCPNGCDTMENLPCCFNCILSSDSTFFLATKDSKLTNAFCYACPVCCAQVNIRIDEQPIASLLQNFISACQTLDVDGLSKLIPEHGPVCNYMKGLSRLVEVSFFSPLYIVLHAIKARGTILTDNDIKIILMLLILKEEPIEHISTHTYTTYLLGIMKEKNVWNGGDNPYWKGYLRPALSFFVENQLACKKNKRPKTIDIHELLDYALANGHMQLVEIYMGTSMLKERSTMDLYHSNKSFNSTYTPWFFAASLGDVEQVTALLEDKDIDVNQVTNDEHKHTALHLAIKNGHDKIVNLLLSHPTIDVNLYNEHQDTLLHFAVQQYRRLQEIYEPTSMTNNSTSMSSNRLKIVKMLLNAKEIKPNQKNKAGLAPIHLAIGGGSQLIETFFASDPCNGLDHNITDNKGNTILHMAVELGCVGLNNVNSGLDFI